MLPVITDARWPVCVCVSVCLLVAAMSCAKMAKPIKMPFGAWTCWGPRNYILGAGLDSPPGKGQFRGHRGHFVGNIWR